ncbi:MAG: zinc ribbon domain-containing protein [Anaerolineales bacterium]|nr:zinc ribbon domain-containing protein [Anaerolineales bacterium]
MSNVTRICPQCGHGNALDARHCAQCGYDTQATLPVPLSSQLPAVITKAAVPVLVGAASLALTAGFKLLQGMLSQPAKNTQQPIQVKRQALPISAQDDDPCHHLLGGGQFKRRLAQGVAEQTIEFDE